MTRARRRWTDRFWTLVTQRAACLGSHDGQLAVIVTFDSHQDRMRYGVEANDVDAVIAAVLSDDFLWVG